MQKIFHKRGDTFLPTCTYLDPVTVLPAALPAGTTVKSQVRTLKGDLVGDLAYAAITGVGKFTLESGSTVGWPTGTLAWDIQFSQGSHVFSTQTAALELSADNTQ